MSDTATVSPTPADVSATPSVAPATSVPESSNGTAQVVGGDAAGAAPSEETFFSGDPNSLPPELQSAYKNMLKDYKQKTEGVADVRKKAEYYDQLASNQKVVEFVKNLNKPQSTSEQMASVEKTLAEKISDDAFQNAFQSKEGFLNLMALVAEDKLTKANAKIEELEQFKSVTSASNLVDAYATEVGKDGKAVRPDFYKLDEDNLITGYLQVNRPEGQSQEAYVQKLNEAYAWAKATTQKYYESGRADALKVIQAKANSSTNAPSSTAKGAYTGPDPKKMTAREAIDLAKRGIRVPQES